MIPELNVPMLAKNYDPVRTCIYCKSKDDKLSKEHIIPLALGGRLILPHASCDSCNKMTSDFEGRLLRNSYKSLRVHLNLPTRHPDEIPYLLPLRRIINGTEESVEEFVPVDEHPSLIPFYTFINEPGILSGKSGSGKITYRFGGYIFQNDMHSRLNKLGKDPILPQPNMLVGDFFRLLAKIAHSFAVAELGINAFKPFLIEYISGKIDLDDYLLGGVSDTQPKGTHLHDISLEERLTGDRKLIVTRVRLFSCLQGPTYLIVTGEKQS